MRNKTTEKLRGCPTCQRPLDESTDIGLRDYSSWAFDHLPGKADGTDIDRVLERRGQFLVWEFKPTKYVPMGQYIFLDALAVQSNWTVYLCVDKKADKNQYLVGRWVPREGVKAWWNMTLDDLKEIETMWWEECDYYYGPK